MQAYHRTIFDLAAVIAAQIEERDNMKYLPNIEKSAFKRGEYVGYGHGLVWRVKRTNSSYGNWIAWPQVRDEAIMSTFPLYGFTLADLSKQLEG